MAEMIKQPDMPRPNLDDPTIWAKLTRINQEWLKQVAPQLGIDYQKLILGKLLNSIVGDDINSFGSFNSYDSYGGKEYLEEYGDLMKDRIIERMSWEIELPETPSKIKKRLRETLDKIKAYDFKESDEHHRAHQLWETRVKKYTLQQINLNPKYKEAESYVFEVNSVWTPHWWKFLGKNLY